MKHTPKKFLAMRGIQRDFSSILSGPVRARFAAPHRLPYLPERVPAAPVHAHAASA
jgi:hypothetical protein